MWPVNMEKECRKVKLMDYRLSTNEYYNYLKDDL